MTIQDKDNTAKFMKELKKFSGSEIRAGILGKKDEQIQVIAAANEFGATIKSIKALRWLFANMKKKDVKPQPSQNKTDGYIHIPERAAIRKAFDNTKNIDDVFRMGQAIFDKTGSLEKAVNAMGSAMVGKVQESYLSNIGPENHPFTTAMKDGKNKTLVNSGRLQQAVTYEIK